MPLIRNILCAVDVSDASGQVMQHAGALASAHEAALLVVYVFHPPAALRLALPQYAGEMLDSAARTELLADLDELAEPLRQRGLSVHTRICEGRPVREIVRAAETQEADLIVMGTRGRSGIGRLVLGSVAEETVRSAGCPVLTVPPGVAEHTVEDSMVSFEHILCPIDFSPESMAALDMAISVAEPAGGTVRVLHVVEWFDRGQLERHRLLNAPDYPGQAVQDAQDRLRSPIRRSARCEINVLDVVVAARPYTAVLREAEAHRTDLIALGVRGSGSADLLISGSTTNRVLREAPCPVLTTRAVS
jgi:nucleotide-binding universal stress UspA family protein